MLTTVEQKPANNSFSIAKIILAAMIGASVGAIIGYDLHKPTSSPPREGPGNFTVFDKICGAALPKSDGTLNELRDWLGQHGAKFESYDGWNHEQYWEPSSSGMSDYMRDQTRSMIAQRGYPPCGMGGWVGVKRMHNEEAARHYAESVKDTEQFEAWNWGYFAFYGDKKILNLIRDKLR